MMKRFILGALCFTVLVWNGFCGDNFNSGGFRSMKILPVKDRNIKPAGVAVAAWPTGIIDADKTHYLNQNSPTIMMIAIANPKGLKIEKSWISVDLPKGVELKATNAHLWWKSKKTSEITHEGKKYLRHKLQILPGARMFPKGKMKRFSAYQVPSIWLESKLPSGTIPGKAYLKIIYKEKGKIYESPVSWVKIGILPPLSAKTPVIAKSGLMGRASISYDREHKEAPYVITKSIYNMGCNFYFDGPPQETSPKKLKRWTEGRNIWQINGGFKHNNQIQVGVGNGFHLHLLPHVARSIPKEIKYVQKNMKLRSNAISPWALYRQHPWVVKNILEPIENDIKQGKYETVWSNWEPFMFMNNGDYSEGSKKEFIQWSKMDAKKVEKLWPHKLVKQYPEKWRKFRNWELGQWTKVVAELIRNTSLEIGSDGYFIISTVNDYMWNGGNIVDSRTWDIFPYVWQTWQYFYIPTTKDKFPVSDRSCAAQVVRSGALVRQVEKIFPKGKAPISSCVYGWDQGSWRLDGRDGFLVPEQLGFLQLSTVLAGMDVVSNYGEWPVFDGRYAAELAKANTRIARWEEYTLKGKKQRKHVTIPVSPYPQTISLSVQPKEQKIKPWETPGYLYSYEYEKNGERIFAIANTWDLGECFMKLKVFDLDPSKKYTLSEPENRRIFTNKKNQVELSAKDLKTGITVHVPAADWGVFLLKPVTKKKSDATFKRVMPKEMEKLVDNSENNLFEKVIKNKKIWAKTARTNAAKSRLRTLGPDFAKRIAIVSNSAGKPQINGILDDQCWKDAKVQNNFRTFALRETAQNQTYWKAVVDQDNLYLAVSCDQNMSVSSSKKRERDGRVWDDDSIEIFISSLFPYDKEDYLQIIISPACSIFDAYKQSRKWNGIEEYAVKKEKNNWTCEVKIPLNKIGIDIKKMPVAKINIFRNIVPNKVNPTKKESSWYPAWGPNNNPLSKGIMVIQ